ncbi:Vta1 like protein [Nitzschia inconspicua]|uniref:Vta1 like protein n=1 Tax=Nitzschia inconspicua TaxID=303405 RepID=A0A9K3PUX0_9STRA|nr:Vta1 like protein [Nitzschia inconspicua]
MPAMKIPPELKKVTPYVRRAEELDKDKTNPESRLVAYYCRQYAVHLGIPLAVSDEGKSCLGQLLGNLEGEKLVMDSFTRDEAKFLCTKFANKVFDNADLEDRTGDATKNTARVFYAAGSFLDILQQFYQDDDQSEELVEIKKKAKYSKWKAAEILKAINDGRKPTPGGYNENQEIEDDTEEGEEAGTPVNKANGDAVPRDPSPKTPATDTLPDDENSVENPPPASPPPPVDDKDEEGTEVELGPPPPAYPGPVLAPATAPPPSIHKPPLTFNPPPAAAAAKPTLPPSRNDDFDDIPSKKASSPKAKKPSFFGFGNGNKNKNKVSKAELADATELTQFALAALQDKDTDLAADRLEQALRVLGRR